MEKYGANFINQDGSLNNGEHLKDMKLIGLYFGAQWCTPCQKFTEKLKEFYNFANSQEEDNSQQLEIIYFPFDQKNTQFLEYQNQMPWISYEFRDEKKIKMYKELKQHIPGIPCLVVIDPNDGKVLSGKGRADVETMEFVDIWLKWNDSKVQ